MQRLAFVTLLATVLAGTAGPAPAGSWPDAAKPTLIRVQDMRIFRLQSPFPVPVRILGPASQGFPQVVMTPGPLGSVPIPYPGQRMRLQVRLPNGQWSGVITLDWSAGVIRLPQF